MGTVPGNTRMWSPSASVGLSLLEKGAGVEFEAAVAGESAGMTRSVPYRVIGLWSVHGDRGRAGQAAA